MNKYTVTVDLADREQFTHFIDNVGHLVGRVMVLVTPGEEESDKEAFAVRPPKPAKVRQPRQPRGSRVNSTILDELERGPRTVKELKEALEEVRLAPGSLSTGLSLLQKAGEVERVGEGLYARKMREAAE